MTARGIPNAAAHRHPRLSFLKLVVHHLFLSFFLPSPSTSWKNNHPLQNFQISRVYIDAQHGQASARTCLNHPTFSWSSQKRDSQEHAEYSRIRFSKAFQVLGPRPLPRQHQVVAHRMALYVPPFPLTPLTSLTISHIVKVWRPVWAIRLRFLLLQLRCLFMSRKHKLECRERWFESLSPVGANPFERVTVYKTWASQYLLLIAFFHSRPPRLFFPACQSARLVLSF